MQDKINNLDRVSLPALTMLLLLQLPVYASRVSVWVLDDYRNSSSHPKLVKTSSQMRGGLLSTRVSIGWSILIFELSMKSIYY